MKFRPVCSFTVYPRYCVAWYLSECRHLAISPAVKPPILSDACIRVRIKYFYSFMTFGPY